MKNKNIILFYIGLFLLIFIFNNMLVSSILYLIEISISKFNFFGALFLSIISLFVLMKINGFKSKKPFILVTIVGMFLIFCSAFVSGKFYDYSYDGSSYHKQAIGELKDGWNPCYEDVRVFDNSFYKSGSDNYVWINSYPKGVYFFGANVYKVFNNIESAKCINILSVIILFCFILFLLLDYKQKILFSLLFTIITISFSVVTAQLLSNYNDILVYIYYVILIGLFFLFENKKSFVRLETKLVMYFIVLCLLINIKFTSFGYAGIYSFVYFIWYIIRFKQKKLDGAFLEKFVITAFFSVIIGVFVIGISTYPLNLLNYKHPFYPVMGDNKVDIMTHNTPYFMRNKTSVEKFLISNFSIVSNIVDINEKRNIKIPFSLKIKELKELGATDIRLAGGGVLIGGLLLISSLLYIVSAKGLYKKNITLFYIIYLHLFVTLLFVLFFSETWWIRYFPQEYVCILLSIIAFYYSNNDNSLDRNIILSLFIGLVLVNNSISLVASSKFIYDRNVEMYSSSKLLKTSCQYSPRKICTKTGVFGGVLYNIHDENEDIIFEEEPLMIESYNVKRYGYIEWRCCK